MATQLGCLLLGVALFVSCEGHALRARDDALRFSQTRYGEFNRYHLYTRANFRDPVDVPATAEGITASGLTATDDVIVIVHGHNSNAFSSLNIPLKDAYISLGDYKVITVDWALWANLNYDLAVSYVPGVGRGLAEFLALVGGAVPLSRVHVLAHGLGAHVAGVAGRLLDGDIGIITGLDPSGNGWDATSQRLTTASAAYVEVIHTDGFGANSVGIGEPLGHVDFFPNGNLVRQPGCTTNACNHDRAWEYLESSLLNPGRFQGARCADLAQMTTNRCVGPTLEMGGVTYPKYASGIYRLTTGRVYPY